MSLKYYHFSMKAISDLHPGAGKDEFSPIDQLIQRNSLGVPHIQYSGTKGCLKEYFRETAKVDWVEEVFGGDKSIRQVLVDIAQDIDKEEEKNTMIKQINATLREYNKTTNIYGRFDFDESILLSLAVRMEEGMYCQVFSPMILQLWEEKLMKADLMENDSGINKLKALILFLRGHQPVQNGAISFHPDIDSGNEIAGEIKVLSRVAPVRDELKTELTTFFGDRPVYLHDKDFMKLSDDFHLPVIVRNKVRTRGENEEDDSNVWSEQVIPRWSYLYTNVGIPLDTKKEWKEDFLRSMDNKVVRLGGNLSVGYGAMRVNNWTNH